MKTKNITINSNCLETDPYGAANILSNSVWWYKNDQLHWYEEYMADKCHGIDIYCKKDSSLILNKLYKNDQEI